MSGWGVAVRHARRRAGVPRHRHLSQRAALSLAPALRPDALVGAIQYYDAQVDDARHTVYLARTAALHGAVMATSARVVGFVRDGERVAGVRVRDLESGQDIELRARVVINATGVWTDELQQLLVGAARSGSVRRRASTCWCRATASTRPQASSCGPRRASCSSSRVASSGSSARRIPTGASTWAHPAASRADIDYLLARVNAVLLTPLNRQDIIGVYAGLRPLLAGESEATSQLSRQHAVAQPAPGLVVVAGGKYTTYRVMGRDAVDAAAAQLGRVVPPSCTDAIPLVGAAGYQARYNARGQIASATGHSVARIEHLLGRYGTAIDELLG